MSSLGYERLRRSYFTPGMLIMALLMIVGLVAAIQRYAAGLGATTNLTDEHPWGIWIAFDVLCGVGLAAGGFTTAAVCYIFGGKKYHALVRPAVLTAFLGYMFVAVGLLVDLGLPWHIWHPIIYWPEHSAMFEVAWCVMLYLTILFLELLPAVFERFGWTAAESMFNRIVPFYSIAALAFFTYIMSHSLPWAGVALVVLLALNFILPAALASRPGVPILLIMAGVLFSTAHQSSLGTLFLLMQDKLSRLWWSPMLPVNFFLTAVAVGFAMVIFEATLAAWGYSRRRESEALSGLGRYCAWVLWLYLVVRLVDVAVQGGYGDRGAGLFWIELLFGVALPALLFSSRRVRDSAGGSFTAAALVIAGVIFNRFNVTLGGMDMTVIGESGPAYVPSVQELLITFGIVAAIFLSYNIAVRWLPLLDKEQPGGHEGTGAASG